MATGASQKITLNVSAGLYVLRYLGGIDPQIAPNVSVTPSPISENDIDIVTAPGLDSGLMRGPGSNLVLVVRRSGSVDLMVRSTDGSRNLDAKFSLDLLAPAQVVRPSAEVLPEIPISQVGRTFERSAPEAAPISIDIAAHVARRGDIGVDGSGWIAGPEAPSAIEGLSIRCNGAAVGVSGQFVQMLEQGRWSEWQAPGAFIGTRQQASPLTAIRLRLVGEDAVRFEVEAAALFLGAPLMKQRGSEVEFKSPGGSDPLVGLKIDIVPAAERQRQIAEQKQSRVRVFRS